MTDLINNPTFTLFLGAIIGFLFSFLIALYQNRCAEKAALSQRLHERQMFQDQVKHDKNMQLRDQNIKNGGVASMREIGGG